MELMGSDGGSGTNGMGWDGMGWGENNDETQCLVFKQEKKIETDGFFSLSCLARGKIETDG